MTTSISPMLAVSDAAAAIDFYVAAFGASELWRIDGGGSIVAGLEIGGSPFFLAEENPPHTNGPAGLGTTTVRIELFVDDPHAVLDRAVAIGVPHHTPIEEHDHVTTGPRPIGRMLQGGVIDPFGHVWLIGRFL